MPCLAHMSMTRSKCLKPDCLRTRGFISSEYRMSVGLTSEVSPTFEVTVVESNADTVQAEAHEELGISILKEVLQELP